MKVKMYVVGNPIPVSEFTFWQRHLLYVPDFGHVPAWRVLENIPKQEILDSLKSLSLQAGQTAFSDKKAAVRVAEARSTSMDTYFEPIAKSCPVFTVMVDFGLNKVIDFLSFDLYVDYSTHIHGPELCVFPAKPSFSYELTDHDKTEISSGFSYVLKRLEWPTLEIKQEDEADLLTEFQPILDKKHKLLIETMQIVRNNNLPLLSDIGPNPEPRLEVGEIERLQINSNWLGKKDPIIFRSKRESDEVIALKEAQAEQDKKEQETALNIMAKTEPLPQKLIGEFL